jgi:hypothetical protein
VDTILSKKPVDRKAQTYEELDVIVNKPLNVTPKPTREVWMHESLEEEARRLWEQMARDC